jgi:hypothetical protein
MFLIEMYRSSEQKAKALKAEIRSLITQGLSEITRSETIEMQYEDYQRGIVLKHGVELIGWTADQFVNPSQLSSALGPLRTLRDALISGTCKFQKLSPEERAERQKLYEAKVVSGEIQPKQRKTRKDAGKKRTKPNQSSPEEVDSTSSSSGDEEAGMSSLTCLDYAHIESYLERRRSQFRPG